MKNSMRFMPSIKCFFILLISSLISKSYGNEAIIEIRTSLDEDVGSLLLKLPATPAAFGGTLDSPSSAKSLQLIIPNPSNGCNNIQQVNGSSNFAFFIRRGECSFEEKVRNSELAGAKLVIISDSLLGIYTSKEKIKYDCSKGEAISSNNQIPSGDNNSKCRENSKCLTKNCLLTGSYINKQPEICCAISRAIEMSKGGTEVQEKIPSVFLTLQYGNMIETVITAQQVYSKVYGVSYNPWNLSMFLLWGFGVIVVLIGARYSASIERLYSKQVVATNYALGTDNSHKETYRPIEDEMDSSSDPLHLTHWHAIGFLVMSSVMLIVLYYVHVLLVLNVFFMLSAILCVTSVVTYPFWLYAYPKSQVIGIKIPSVGFITLSSVLSLIPSLIISIWWFIDRKESYMWPLQNFFGLCLCLEFFNNIHLPNFRVGTILLIAAFCYDVFFVYVSPYVFGSNVMVAVASSGGNVKFHGHDHCERYPEAYECLPEIMPLVFKLPLMGSDYSGSAMLGFGDIVIPGLLVSFALRYDYFKGYPISKHYFMIAGVSYAIGLLVANIMAVVLRNIVAGQPALMYIVPSMLISIFVYSYSRGEFQDIWKGIKASEEEEERQSFLSNH